jgi:DNA gyrase subunit B
MVNNVPISGMNSDHISVPFKLINEEVAFRIPDKAVEKFYRDQYKLPLFLAVDIKFEGAKFGGTTKETFRDPTFREIFRTELEEYFASDVGKTLMDDYYTHIHEDIYTRYNESLGIKIIPKDRGRLALRLKRPDKFKDSGDRNPNLGELFLVEGDSAGGSAGYDTANQAIYKLGGKPLNIVRYQGESRVALIDRMLSNDIYHDILTIIGYDLRSPNLNTLNFKNCLLMSDSDN